jgi:nicotinamidase-related amidase
VIDVQQGIVDEGPHDAEAFLGHLGRLIAAARAGGVPVFHVQHADGPGEQLIPGTPAWEFHPTVKPLASEPVFAKTFNSAFKGTALETTLMDRGVKTLVVCGMQTEHCLDATIKSAFEKGFQVMVPEGSHTTFDNGGLTAVQVKDFYQNRVWKERYAEVEAMDVVVERLRTS